MFGAAFSVSMEMYTVFRTVLAAFDFGVTIATYVYGKKQSF